MEQPPATGTVEHLKHGQCNRRTEFLILSNLNLNRHACLVATELDSATSELKGVLAITESTNLILQRKKLDPGLWSRKKVSDVQPADVWPEVSYVKAVFCL